MWHKPGFFRHAGLAAGVLAGVCLLLAGLDFALRFWLSRVVVLERDCDLGQYETYRNTSHYRQASHVLPDLETLPPYLDIYFEHLKLSQGLGCPRTITLVLTYSEETFYAEADSIPSRYTFLDAPVLMQRREKDYTIPQPEFELGSFFFRVVQGEQPPQFPKRIGMIGISEETKRIAYLYFADTDLDYIDDSMADFVKTYFLFNDW